MAMSMSLSFLAFCCYKTIMKCSTMFALNCGKSITIYNPSIVDGHLIAPLALSFLLNLHSWPLTSLLYLDIVLHSQPVCIGRSAWTFLPRRHILRRIIGGASRRI